MKSKLGHTLLGLFFVLLLFSHAKLSIAQTNYAAGACSLIPSSKVCVDATPCKTSASGVTACLAGTTPPSGAVQVAQSCWQYSYQYACSSPSSVNTCTQYQSNPACTITNSICTNNALGSSQCSAWNNTYSCITSPAVTKTQTVCSQGTLSPLSLPTPANNNNTFSKAAVASEIVSQAQLYSKNGSSIFMGTPESCTMGYFGIKDCCKSTPGAKSNSVVMGLALGAAGSVIKYAGESAISAASPYVYDAMYNVGIWTSGMETAQLFAENGQMFGAASSGFSLGAYGFTYNAGAYSASVAGSGLGGGASCVAGCVAGAEGYVTFNPYVFAAIVAIQVIQSLAQCSTDEQMLALHKGASLSVQNTEYCSNKIPILGTCIETTRTYCSFNSVLAKIVNVQGKPQLGMNVADCTGFTTDQLSKLDFSKIDFSEFISSLKSQATTNQPTNLNSNYTPLMNKSTQGSQQAPHQGLSYPASATTNR